MKVCGIIAEYNPFHLGHAHQIKKTRRNEDELLVVVMSGSFVQRGEISLWSKWQRAQWALSAGADMVVELPCAFVLQSAEFFANAAVKLLKQLTCKRLCFGSEIGNVTQMLALNTDLNQPETRATLQRFLKEGKSYPRALSEALNKDTILQHPNATLGLSYLQAIKRIAPEIEAQIIQRKGAAYHDIDLTQNTPSASAIRAALATFSEREAVLFALPSFMRTSFAQSPRAAREHLESLILYSLRSSSPAALKKLHGVDEGLENLLCRAAKAPNFPSFMEQLKSKRYTMLRLQRMLCKILLKLSKDSAEAFNEAQLLPLHILAFRDRAQPLIKQMRLAKLPYWISHKEFESLPPTAKEIASFDCLATDLQALCFQDAQERKGGKDFLFHSICRL